MAEREFALVLPDNKLMYVSENTAPGNRRAIVHIHGLTHDGQQHASIVMAGTLVDEGYAIYRPSLYSWKKDARSLADCTIRQHADDVNVLLASLQGKYDKVFISGHSYGATTALECDLCNVAALSLWDPSYVPASFMGPTSPWIKHYGDIAVFKGGVEGIVGKAMLDEGIAYTLDVARIKSRACPLPVQVVHAGAAMWAQYEGGESYHSHAAVNDYRVIESASHSFTEVGMAEKLTAATKEWFDKF